MKFHITQHMMTGHRRPNRSSNTPRIRLFVTIGIYFTTIIFGELLARAFLTSPSNRIFDAELNFTYQPNTTIFQTKEGIQVSQINSLGLADSEHNFSPDREILVILGDSYTEALHVPFEERFTSRLDQHLTGYDVVNAARTGLHPATFTVVARRLTDKFPIHRFLLVLSPGDSTDILAENFSIQTTKYGSPRLIIQANKTLQKMRRWIEPFTSRSALARFLVQRYLPDVKLFYARIIRSFAKNNGHRQMEPSENTQDSKDRKVALVLDISFSELSKIAPFDILFIPNFKYTGKNTIVESNNSQHWEEVMRKTADRYNARFVSAGADLSFSYRKYRQPLTGFSNSGLFRGHFNTLGHTVLARSALKLFNKHQSIPVTSINH